MAVSTISSPLLWCVMLREIMHPAGWWGIDAETLRVYFKAPVDGNTEMVAFKWG